MNAEISTSTNSSIPTSNRSYFLFLFIPVIFQVASLLAALAHPGHIVIYAPGDSLPYRRDVS
ncbi:hypothetical protein [Photorhabdus africana]|uniref:hypothetical protein n=1 Tax=Photorhabdus africana TaxID=3097554 RepID=UPI002B40FD59|nr:hypothetical protein [Photorhabdus sp. CRI-LC]